MNDSRHDREALRSEIHRSIESVDADSWDAVVGGDDPLCSRSYLRLVERTLPGEFDWRYLVLRQDDGSIAAHAVFYRTRLPLDILVASGHPLARVLATWRRRLPRLGSLRVVASGPPAAIGNSVTFRAGLPSTLRRQAVRALVAAMRGLARRDGIRLLVVRDIRHDDGDLASALGEEGLVRVSNQDDTELALAWRTVDEYLAALRGRYRKLILRQERAARAAGLRLERTHAWQHVAEDMARLFAATAARHTAVAVPREDYFVGLMRLGDRAGVTLLWLDSRLVGFILYLRGDSTLVPTYLGVDYEINRRVPLVFLAFYDMVRLAIESQVTRLRFGRTAYAAKMRLGATRTPLSLYAAVGGATTTALAGRLARRFGAPGEREQWRAFRSSNKVAS